MDFVLFMVFSLFESLGFFSLTFALYRIRLEEYWLPVLVTSVIMQVVNFYIRNSDHSVYAPVVLFLFVIMFMSIVVKMPIFWAFIVSFTGNFAFTMLQALFVLLFIVINFMSQERVHYESGWQAHIVQILTGVLAFFIGRYLYRRGLGYSFLFDKVQLHLGLIGLFILLIIMTVAVGTLFYLSNLVAATGILLLGLILLIFFSQRKEKADAEDGL